MPISSKDISDIFATISSIVAAQADCLAKGAATSQSPSEAPEVIAITSLAYIARAERLLICCCILMPKLPHADDPAQPWSPGGAPPARAPTRRTVHSSNAGTSDQSGHTQGIFDIIRRDIFFAILISDRNKHNALN
ncbi:hypothetical protein FN846DRAFT_902336 [Sphaerosporella brunnea]|uniref:Uncharacterized protein n=1 Tax=Sphaerosporella brunnea TaxID=1250544 RepID=A0A5J5F9D4_9PEZI|nr:hypothetical protein FN846DRAFT_902336 [Sphaerosporella brunnea]